MKYNFLLSGITLLSGLVLNLDTSVSFDYSFKVVAASNSYLDVKRAYLYKEKLINHYEENIMPLNQKDHLYFIKNNIETFNFDNNCHAYYNGSIILIINQGLGYTLKGKLKQNICDDKVIHEKFYLFELFN